MNALKLAFDYRISEGHQLKTFSEQYLELSRQQLGSAIGGRKKLTEEILIAISKKLNIPLSFFDIEVDVPEPIKNIERRIIEKNVFNEKTEISHIIATILTCYNTLVKYILEHYTVPDFNKDLSNIVPNNFVVKDNKITCCEENKELLNVFIDNFVSYFNAKNKCFGNIFNILESNGIFVFSFVNNVWYSEFNSHFLLTNKNPIIFIERSSSVTEQRILLLQELSEILCCKKYGENVCLNHYLKQRFAFRVLLQDGLTNSISSEIYNYEKICKTMRMFNVSAKCVLSRLKDLNRIDITDHKIHEASKAIEKYYHFVYLKEIDDLKSGVYDCAKCNDHSTLLKKIEDSLNKNHKSWEYVANSVGLTLFDINQFCFNIDSNRENTVKNNLKFI